SSRPGILTFPGLPCQTISRSVPLVLVKRIEAAIDSLYGAKAHVIIPFPFCLSQGSGCRRSPREDGATVHTGRNGCLRARRRKLRRSPGGEVGAGAHRGNGKIAPRVQAEFRPCNLLLWSRVGLLPRFGQFEGARCP